MAARAYTDRTLKILWGRAAGRCAFPNCRMELLADATDYDPIVVIGEIAHLVAAGDQGPRADAKLEAKKRNEYDNLILLCQNCHAIIDGQPNSFPLERIMEIKAAHEDWVRHSLPERGRSRNGWRALHLAGDHQVDMATAEEAIGPDFIAGEIQLMRIPSVPDSWPEQERRIADHVNGMRAAGDFDFRLAIFPLAPVSACICLGYYLTSRLRRIDDEE